jgi:hypothetical protein
VCTFPHLTLSQLRPPIEILSQLRPWRFYWASNDRSSLNSSTSTLFSSVISMTWNLLLTLYFFDFAEPCEVVLPSEWHEFVQSSPLAPCDLTFAAFLLFQYDVRLLFLPLDRLFICSLFLTSFVNTFWFECLFSRIRRVRMLLRLSFACSLFGVRGLTTAHNVLR